VRPFEYSRPATVEEAVAALAAGVASRVLAGGTDLIPQMREGRREVSRIVDVKQVPELTAIESLPGGGLRIGAAASVAALGRHAAIARDHPALLASGRMIGSLQIQARASLGGNLCNGAPSADAAPILLCQYARAEIAGPNGRRRIDVAELFAAPGRTTLAPGELLVSITLPPRAPSTAACYLRFTPRREMDIAVAGVAATLQLEPDGRIGVARIALASVAPTPMLAPEAGRTLAGERPTSALFRQAGLLAARSASPISDTRGSAEYRRELVAVLTARALAQCARELRLEVEMP
jgi:carbon-monoxide dehydrogenase medium subunit